MESKRLRVPFAARRVHTVLKQVAKDLRRRASTELDCVSSRGVSDGWFARLAGGARLGEISVRKQNAAT